MILISKVLKMPFSHEKLQLHCNWSYRSKFRDKCLFVYLLSVEIIFLPMADDQTFSNDFRCKTAEWDGHFVVSSPEVSLRIISFRRLFGLPVWNFGHQRVNLRSLWWLVIPQAPALLKVTPEYQKMPKTRSCTFLKLNAKTYSFIRDWQED